MFKYLRIVALVPWVLICSLALTPGLQAEDHLDELTEMTLVNPATLKSELGSLNPETALQRSKTVSIISKEDIARYNFQSLGEALRILAGIEVERTHLKKNIPVSRGLLQPHYPTDTLLMIDGVPTWSATFGDGNFSRVNIHDVERMEVLKGPAGALYGDHAFSAVVNVILRAPEEEGIQLHAGLGDEEKYFGGVNYSTKLNGFDLYMSVNQSTEGGEVKLFRGTDATGDVKEFEEGGSYLFRLKNQNHRFLFNAFRSVDNSLGITPSFSNGAGADYIQAGYLGNYRYRRDLSAASQLELGVTFDWTERDFDGPPGENFKAEGYRYRFYAQTTGRFNERTGYRLEADYDVTRNIMFRSNTQATIPSDDLAGRYITEYSLMGRLDHSWESWKVEGAARVSHNGVTGTEFAPHLAMVYALNESNSLKLTYDEAYRLPSLLELYTNAGTVLQGNSELDAQKSRSVELGYAVSRGQFFAQLSGWWASVDNRIFRDRFSNATNTYKNATAFDATGLEMELNYTEPKSFSAFLNANYYYGTDGDDSGSGVYNSLYVPDVSFTAGLSMDWNLWTLSAILNYVGKMTGLEGLGLNTQGIEKTIDPTAVIDLVLARKQRLWGIPVLHRFAVKNATDEETSFPEFTRNEVGSIPWQNERRIIYDLTVNFR